MEVVRGRSWEKPLPEPDPLYSEFWRAAADGRLLYQRCPACGHAQFYPRPLCLACGADPEWVEASGQGEVYTFTVVRQYGAKPFRDELPYVVAMIQLPEGVQMLGGVTDIDPDAVRIGLPVEAYAIDAGDGVGVPYWRPR